MKAFFEQLLGAFKRDGHDDASGQTNYEANSFGQNSIGSASIEEQANLVKLKEGEKKEAIKKMFETKKDKIVKLIKKRQRIFVSELSTAQGSLFKESGNSNEVESHMCAITREDLTSKTTFYMYSQVHFSNVFQSLIKGVTSVRNRQFETGSDKID